MRNPYIDQLRGVSILAVMLLHYIMFCPRDFLPANTYMGKAFDNGNYGVMMFFVISGFLITKTIKQRWGDGISVSAFYRMRAARILPGLVFVLFYLSALSMTGAALFTVPKDRSLGEAIWYATTFRYHWLLGQNNVPGMIGWSPLWSLSVEELFYLLYPLLILALPRRALLAALVLLIATGPYHRLTYGHYGFMGAVDCLAAGCLAARIQNGMPDNIKRLARIVR